MRQRGSFAIKILILDALNSRRLNRTRLMYDLVLNYDRVIRYTDSLLKAGMIDYDKSDNTFGITAKGLYYLDLSKELASYVQPINNFVEKYRVSKYFDEGQPLESMALRERSS